MVNNLSAFQQRFMGLTFVLCMFLFMKILLALWRNTTQCSFYLYNYYCHYHNYNLKYIKDVKLILKEY